MKRGAWDVERRVWAWVGLIWGSGVSMAGELGIERFGRGTWDVVGLDCE